MVVSLRYWPIKLCIGLLFLGVFFFLLSVDFYTDWLWFQALGYASVFWTMVLSRFGLRLIMGIVFFAFIFINLQFTRELFFTGQRLIPEDNPLSRHITRRRLVAAFFGVSLVFGLLFSGTAADYWETMQRFIHGTEFGIQDPIFSRDVGFFVFSLPFLRFLQSFIMALLVLGTAVTAIAYFLSQSLTFEGTRFQAHPRSVHHLSVLFGLLFLTKAWGYWLDQFALLFSPRGVVFGAGYTDINANLLGLRILFGLTVIVGLFIFSNIYIRRIRLILVGVVLIAFVSLLVGNIYPAFLQQFRVEPNELNMERQFIAHNIDMTRKAYGLDVIQKYHYDFDRELTYEDVQNNRATVDNVRLWDYRPLSQTFRQLQEMRLYYSFTSVDTDRYQIGDRLQQVMLSAREMEHSKLPPQAQTWVNRRLQYTHGFGLVMSPVNRIGPGSLPEFLIKDIPPRSAVDEIELERPEIYYGEVDNGYVFTNTKTPEFSYPAGDENVFTNYEGEGGVEVGSYINRIAFALRFGTAKILLTDDILPTSRAMYIRDIRQRVEKVAPFLDYDRDPYLVVSDGRLFWIQDAYTTTNMFPYSEPTRGWGNYIRNSVKVVIDAYHGHVDFYIVDEDDPLAMTYQAIFPDLFRPFEEMPDGLKNHIRYPEDLFSIQAEILRTYHMQNPVVFYNREDVWDIPFEIFAGNQQRVEPYYIVMELPEGSGEEFVLMQPYTPARRDNMVSWLAARSDLENYGELQLYLFPKDRLAYGPSQIEARIDQDPDISQQLSLWSQLGSRVIRGNLLVLPIANSLLYAEPIYLQADRGDLPQLSRVILAYGDEIVMEPTMEVALARLFGEEIPEEVAEQIPYAERRLDPDIFQEGLDRAYGLYREAKGRLAEGDLGGYADLIDELGEYLEELMEEAEEVADEIEGFPAGVDDPNELEDPGDPDQEGLPDDL